MVYISRIICPRDLPYNADMYTHALGPARVYLSGKSLGYMIQLILKALDTKRHYVANTRNHNFLNVGTYVGLTLV